MFAKFENELIEAEVNLCFDLVVQELLTEVGQGVVGRVIIQVQGVQYTPVREGQVLVIKLESFCRHNTVRVLLLVSKIK